MSGIFDEFAPASQRRLNQVRLQFLADGNWIAQLAESGLPPEVQALIEQTIQQTKLWRFEKAEVASEMIAHFQDGHQRGITFEELQATFGDPLVTAKLIRNSKKRNRPMIMKASKFMLGVGSGFGLLYLGLLAFFHSASPNPSTDYTAIFNAPVLSTPEDQRAWPIYREAWTKHEFSEGQGGQFEELYVPEKGSVLGEEAELSLLATPDDEQWEVAIKKLNDSQDLLDAFRQGHKLPYLGVAIYPDAAKYSKEDFKAMFPGRDRAEFTKEQSAKDSVGIEGLSEEGSRLVGDIGIGTLLPHIWSFRKAALIFVVDTRLAIQENDSNRAAENIEAILGLSRQASETPFLVCSRVGVATATIGIDLIKEVNEEHPGFFSDEQLEQIQIAFKEIDFTEYFSFEGERAMSKDLIQRVYSDDGNGDGRVTPVGLEVAAVAQGLTRHDYPYMPWIITFKDIVGPAYMATAASRKEVTAKLDSLVDEVNQRFDVPFWLDDMRDIAEDMARFREENTVPIPITFANFRNVKAAKERVTAQRDAVVLALAITRFEREQERLPVSFEELQEGFLESVPLDRMTGDPLKFRVDEDGGFVIYSVGKDLDDDRGIPTELNISPWGSRHEFVNDDGDWVLWQSTKAE